MNLPVRTCTLNQELCRNVIGSQDDQSLDHAANVKEFDATAKVSDRATMATSPGSKWKKFEIMIKKISVSDAHAKYSDGETILIDVRQPDEWADGGRPEGAIGLTLQDPDFLAKLDQIVDGNKDKPVAFNCKGGGRSMKASELAVASGFTNISNVEGGFMSWVENKLPTDKGPF